jgi:putative ABC transport system ATP-binding protein
MTASNENGGALIRLRGVEKVYADKSIQRIKAGFRLNIRAEARRDVGGYRTSERNVSTTGNAYTAGNVPTAGNVSTSQYGVRALKGVNLDVYPGEFVAILGKSGAGKTTLVNMLTGVDRPTAGEVWVEGVPVHALNDAQLALWRGRNLGIVYQSFYLMPTLSVLDNVMLPIDFCGLYRPRLSRERALELLRQVELEEHAGKLPSAISGGQQQRVAIARALANDPTLIVADEPTGRLDSTTAETIFKIFLQLIERGKTILMVTHDQGLAQRVSRQLSIVDGEIFGADEDETSQVLKIGEVSGTPDGCSLSARYAYEEFD